MPREQIRTDYTEDEIKNLEAEKCFCGKPRSEFDKLMRVYCCMQHRSDWYARTITWSNFRDEVLEERGKKCVKCGCTPESLKKSNKSDYHDWLNEVKQNQNAMKMIQIIRVEKLNDLEKQYQQIMNDDYLIKWNLDYKHDIKNLRQAPNEDHFVDTRFEVDHILAISLGGETWDKSNLQILCYKDHKIKTKEDMRKLKAKRKEEKSL